MAETIGYAQEITSRPNKGIRDKAQSAWDRLQEGMNFRQKEREAEWRHSAAQYEGATEWYDVNDPTADLVQVNISFSTINTLIPFVADENPTFEIVPYSGDSNEEHAKILESFMNRLWQSSDVQGTRAIRDASFDWLVLGDGYVKVNYQIKPQPVYSHDGELLENTTDIAEYSIDRLSPWDVWLDPYSDGLYNARWVCQRINIPKKELENDDRFYVPRDFFSSGVDDRNQAPQDDDRLLHADADSEWVTLFEFYDLKEDWMITVTTGGTQILRYVTGVQCPIVQMPNYRIPESPYHMGELEQIAPLQEELNKTRSQMITHRRRNVVKYMVREQVLTPEAEQALKSSKIGDSIPIPSNDPFDTIIAPLEPAQLSPDSYAIDAQIRADINEVTGVNEYLRGVPQDVSRTATEATIIEGATNIRTRHKLLQVETAAQQVGQLLLDIMRDTLPLTAFEEMSMYITGREAEKLNRITGQENPQQNVTLVPAPELFEGRYEVRVERGSTELRNPEAKAERLMNIVQMMLTATPLLQQLQVPFNIRKLLVEWFESEGFDDVESFFMIDEDQALAQQLMLLQQAQEATGGPAGPGQPANGAPSQIVGGTATQPGQPRPETSAAPSALPDQSNSGILGPSY